MIFHFREQFPQLNVYWEKYLPHMQRMEVPAKTALLKEGQVSQNYILIETGCVRAYFDKDGVDKTVQFFFENSGLSSFDSFVNELPSLFTIETIEPSVVYLLSRTHVLELMDELSHEPSFVQIILGISAARHKRYNDELVSFIRDTPEERYLRLLTQRPHIVKRVQQHYIASYLGVSSVHLSRIKSKLARGREHF
ncbi:CRP-like cAMP-binding protein [Dyadobacter sp. BE34]|uniref:CRP-like cAMP-binding protein n=1 Tax=Dyadobacter fermentans TaxID=94254 RepID=A0ABU1QXW1_9BACT|nr:MULTISPECIES: Crp/Fnr family transcriptional regulator [Dyadobacter]MDR6805998.1 CRP-like cAMP-binding protein [Dyadobacter fermentans]MDR7043738.1 CRP-like cAMP-binding protein [Dyadobacter sp. BE242]MDR7198050.1 CRP-like cAMP-binding protein [Dyadobacter sp. BE34]MDR7216012.1 CRP-like cAMP-binding protein [Dyadobacter sp. BE31]MDR7264462.1 CRP-like cAMP-binding protein [Dyadobacter sp. BE32]